MTEVLCILAAGLGTRLGPLTQRLSKALLPVGNQAAISRILNMVPQVTEVVIAVGYQSEQLLEYCLAAHPNTRFTFVPVKNYQGEGSGPGHSLECCREYLQRPFYLACCDSICDWSEPEPLKDWLASAPSPPAPLTQYSTLSTFTGRVSDFKNKSLEPLPEAFAGFAHVYSYRVFWEQLDANAGQDPESEFVRAWYNPSAYPELNSRECNLYDVGSLEGYQAAQQRYQGEVLGMPKVINEVTYHVGNRLVKLAEPQTTHLRASRAGVLPNTPPISFWGQHVVAFPWIQGETLYDRNDPQITTLFLHWCERELWHRPEVPPQNFFKQCHQFYYDKTLSRVDRYKSQCGLSNDGTHIILGREVPPVETLLELVDWDTLSHGTPRRFHGDLQLDNVLVTAENQFYLLDWRPEFTNDTPLDCGDLYYDLAKLKGSTFVPYHRLKRGHYEFKTDGQEISYSFFDKEDDTLLGHSTAFDLWALEKGLDLKKITLMAGLVLLNMAPLHPFPMGDLFFSHGKLILDMALRGGQ